MSKTIKRKLSLGEMAFCLAIFATAIFIIKPDILQSFMPRPLEWTADMKAKHLAARAGCRKAQALGLGHAYKGQPGYWPEWDGDGDGISCERW